MDFQVKDLEVQDKSMTSKNDNAVVGTERMFLELELSGIRDWKDQIMLKQQIKLSLLTKNAFSDGIW